MKGRFLALLLPPTAWLAVFLLLPTAVLAAAAFSADGLQALGRAETWLLFWRSFWVAAVSTAACLAVSYPVAYFIAGCAPRRRNLLLFLVVLPFWTNLLVRTYALKFCLDPLGWSDTGAVIFAIVQNFLPFMILPLYASLEKLDRGLLEAAGDLGATPWRAFWRVTIPLTMPGIVAGVILVFIPSVGQFVVSDLLGGAKVDLLGNLLQRLFMVVNPPNWPLGSAMALVFMLVLTVAVIFYFRVTTEEDR